MDVRVYWNLTRGVWSVQARVDGKWKVIGHAKRVNVRDAKFKVSEAGRQRVLRTGHKNVHAYVTGWLEGAIWIERRHSKTEYTSWLKSDLTYWKYGTQHGHRCTYNQRKAWHFEVLADFQNWQEGRTALTRIDFAHMVCMETAGILPHRRGNVWAFDPCSMPVEGK